MVPNTRDPSPIAPEAGAVPTNDCFRCHDDEAPLPARQELASSYPKQSIDKAEFSPGMSALRTANCWRRARISSSILLRSQKSLLVTAKRDMIMAIMAFSYNRKEAYGCYHVDFKGGRSFGEGQGFLCVTEHHIGLYSAAFGPKFELPNRDRAIRHPRLCGYRSFCPTS